MKACFSRYFIGVGGLCGKFYGCRTALKKPQPWLLPIVPQDQLLRSISHWSQCWTSHWIQCSCYLFQKKHFNWLRTIQTHIHLAYVNTFLFLLSPLSVSTHNVSLPICSVCIKLAKTFVAMTVGFPKSSSFKFGKVWKCITSPLGAKRKCSLAGERPSVSVSWGSPVLPQDPGCMSPPPCLCDAGTSAHLTMLWPDQGTVLTGDKYFLWAGLVSSRISGCICLSCAATWAAAPTHGRQQEGMAAGGREHPFWQLPAGLMTSDQIMAFERTVLSGSGMHWGWNMSKEGTRGISKGKSCLLFHQNCSEPTSYCTVSHTWARMLRTDYVNILFALLRFIMQYLGC